MALIVQKYGGTSLADRDRMRHCAGRAVAAQRDGHHVVVVVSAMGSRTDELLRIACDVNEAAPRRELDLLLATGEQMSAALMAMTIQALDERAIAFSASESGIVTDGAHGEGRIESVDPTRIRQALDNRTIPVVPGFQGVAVDGAITTLGRGGSDTTAVAVAAALGVTRTGGVCEIHTDVEGVFTADPRLVPEARRLERIGYEEMLELASLGAGVMHPRAVMLGRRYDVPIHVGHSQLGSEGTMIVRESPTMKCLSVVGCVLTPDLGRVTICGLSNAPGVQSTIFRKIADAGLCCDDIMQTERDGAADVSFTIAHHALGDVKLAVAEALEAIGAAGADVQVEVGLAKLSAVGVGMRTQTGVAAAMFRALGDAGIEIRNITTSEIKLSCIIPRQHGERALRIVHDVFGLAGEKADARAGAGMAEMKPIRDSSVSAR
jgi:aspartate kinase